MTFDLVAAAAREAWHRGDLAKALEGFDRALAAGDPRPTVRMWRGMLELARSDCQHGWTDFEARLACAWSPPPPEGPPRLERFSDFRSMVTGEPIGDVIGPVPRRLLVECWDGGPGDVLLFSRYLPRLRATLPETEIIIDPTPGTRSWLHAELPDATMLVGHGDELLRSQCDARVSLFSLHQLLLGDGAPPLAPSEPFGSLLEHEHARSSSKLVLVASKGRSLYWDARRRDLPDDEARELQARLWRAGFDVQVLPSADEWHALPPLGREAASAAARALMLQARCMVATDTGAEIEAATLGCPVALLLHHVPNWRWGTGDADPWFPAGRRKFFRQRVPGDWSGPIDEAIRWVGTL